MVSGAAAANVMARVACARALRARGSGGGGHPGEMPRVLLGPCWAAGGHLLPPSLRPFLRPQGEQGLWGFSLQTTVLWDQAPPYDLV